MVGVNFRWAPAFLISVEQSGDQEGGMQQERTNGSWVHCFEHVPMQETGS